MTQSAGGDIRARAFWRSYLSGPQPAESGKKVDSSWQKAPELALRGLWTPRSEVAGDVDAAGDAVRVVLERGDHPVDRADRLAGRRRPQARRRLMGVLVHQLEGEIEKRHGIPVSDAANDPAFRIGRKLPKRIAPVELDIRSLRIEREDRREVMLVGAPDRPGRRRRPDGDGFAGGVGAGGVISIANRHGQTVAVDRAVFTPHAVRNARIP